MLQRLRNLRFKGLWILIVIFSTLILYSSRDVTKLKFTAEFIDRHWFSLKQKLQRVVTEREISDEIRLETFDVAHSIDFWLSAETKKSVWAIAKNHSGPILTNFHLGTLKNDTVLKPLLEKQNFILPVEAKVQSGGSLQAEIQDFFEKRIEPKDYPKDVQPQAVREEWLKAFSYHPASLEYFKKNRFYGHQNLFQELGAQFVYSYPVVRRMPFVKGGLNGFDVFEKSMPSPALGALALKYGCEGYFYSKSFDLELKNCKGGDREFFVKEQLPIYFYEDPVFDSRDPDSILILEVRTPSLDFASLTGERYHWGKLTATVLSNLLQSHTPLRPNWLALLELALCIVLFFWLFFASQYYRSKGTTTAVIAALLGLVAVDLILSLFFNLRTHFTDKILIVAITGIVAVVTRALLDFDERSIIERALAGYVSEDRLKRLLKGKSRLNLEGRRRQMTTMLVDIKGFSKLSDNLGAKGVFEFSRKFFSLVDPVVFRFGGTIDKKTGDGFLAFFGDFEEDDDPELAARQAIKCGLAIQKRLKEQQEKNPQIFGLKETVLCRVGINSGPMMIGNTGSKRHFNYTVLGTAVNFTQRLEAACSPEKVMVGKKTKELTQTEFEFVERQIEVKNEDGLFVAYEVVV